MNNTNTVWEGPATSTSKEQSIEYFTFQWSAAGINASQVLKITRNVTITTLEHVNASSDFIETMITQAEVQNSSPGATGTLTLAAGQVHQITLYYTKDTREVSVSYTQIAPSKKYKVQITTKNTDITVEEIG